MNKEQQKYEDVFTLKNFRFLIVVFAIVALLITTINNLDFDSYIKDFIMPVLILISTFVILLERMNLVKNRKAYLYLIPISLSLFSYLFIKIDENNMFLNVFFIYAMESLFFLSLVNNNYSLTRNFVVDFLGVFPDGLFSNLKYLQLAKSKKATEKNKKGFNIFLGCLIGIPIAIIILSLLTDADIYFKKFIETVFAFIKKIIDIEYFVPNTIMIVVSFMIMFSTFVNLLKKRNDKETAVSIKSVNSSIVNTVLIIINSVFVLFLISEISKFTINFLRLPIEYTYSSYAREGFFQLLVVTLINISIILYFVYFTTTVKENKLLRKLLTVLTIFSIFLIISSYYRVILYIFAYSFTVLRAQVVLFLVMELVIFAVIIKKILKGITKDDAMTYMLIVMSVYLLNLYLCSEPFINLINSIM